MNECARMSGIKGLWRVSRMVPTERGSSARVQSGGHRLVFANHLRGVAAMSVVFGHLIAVYWGPRELVAAFTATPVQLGPPSFLYPLIARPWLNLGPFGVAIFFLISGLVVPISLDHHSRASFLAARLLRIFPTFVTGAVLCLGVVWLNSRFWGLPFPPGFDAGTIAGTLLLVQDAFGTTDFTLVAWTLCIELKFYLVVAIFAPAIRRGSVGTIFAIAFAALAVDLAWGSPVLEPWWEAWPQFAQMCVEAHCIVFMLIGVLFNYHLRGLLRAPAFAAGICALSAISLAGLLVGPQAAEYPLTPANYGYALVLFSALYALRRFVRPFKPLDGLAAVSFPLYVVHGLTGYSTLKFLILWVGLGYRTALVLTIATVLACATVLHVTVERWSIRAGKRLAKRRHPAAAGLEPAPVHLLASPGVQRT